MKIGFIGLGQLGKTIAGRLIGAGEKVTVWNRTRARTEGMAAAVADSPAALIDTVDLCFLCLFDSAAVSAVLSGPDGLLSGNCAGKVIVDLTTNHFEPVTGFHSLATARDAAYLESPVFGSVDPASQGMLTIVVSGNPEAYSTALPYLQMLGKHIFFLEKPGLATRLKLINNLLLGSFMAAIAESVVLAEAAGIAREQALDIFQVGAGNSGVLTAKRQKLLSEDFEAHFSTALIHKDLTCLLDLAASLNRPAPSGVAARAIYDRAMSDEYRDLDFSVLYRVFKEAGPDQ